MVYASRFPSLPAWDDFDIPIGSDGDPEEESPQYRAYESAYRAAADAEDRTYEGIPNVKLSFNEGALVTPYEIETALARSSRQPSTMTSEDVEFWTKWLDFLATAKDHGGLRAW